MAVVAYDMASKFDVDPAQDTRIGRAGGNLSRSSGRMNEGRRSSLRRASVSQLSDKSIDSTFLDLALLTLTASCDLRLVGERCWMLTQRVGVIAKSRIRPTPEPRASGLAYFLDICPPTVRSRHSASEKRLNA